MRLLCSQNVTAVLFYICSEYVPFALFAQASYQKYLLRTTESSKKELESAYDSKLIIDSKEFTFVVKKLRNFFLERNFVEAHPQNRLSILAAL